MAHMGIRFKKKLRSLLPEWEREDLISPEQAERLSRRYDLDRIDSQAMGLLMGAIYSFGIVLVAVGIISFVAFHWEHMNKWLKVGLITAAMLAAHTGGFVLWKVRGSFPRLGHALVTLGTLIYGANIGLIAQIFHIRGQISNAFVLLAAGAVLMAYALGSVPNAVVAIVSVFIWFASAGMQGYEAVNWWLPYTFAAVFVTFSFWRRSPLTFTLSLISLSIYLALCGPGQENEETMIFFTPLATGLLFYLISLALPASPWRTFAKPARLLALVNVFFALFVWGFRDAADEFLVDTGKYGATALLYPGLVCLVLSVIAAPPLFAKSRRRRDEVLLFGGLLITPLFIGALAFLPNPWPAAVAANVLFAALAAVLIYAGVIHHLRLPFWSGVVLIGLQIVARTLEYETGLLGKSAVFTACGLGLIAAGVLFEKYLKRQEVHNG